MTTYQRDQIIFFVFPFSIFSGHHSILVSPTEVEINPAVWLTAVSQYKGEPPATYKQSPCSKLYELGDASDLKILTAVE